MTTDYRPQARNKDLCLLLQALKETYSRVPRCRQSPVMLWGTGLGDTKKIAHKFCGNYQ